MLRSRSLSANGERQQQKLRGWHRSALWTSRARLAARRPHAAAHRFKKDAEAHRRPRALRRRGVRRAFGAARLAPGQRRGGDGRARAGGRAGAGRAREEDGHQQPQGHDHPLQIPGRPRPRGPPGARVRAEPHRGLLRPPRALAQGVLRRVEHGDHRLPAPGRAQARPRRDGRLRRLFSARPGHHVALQDDARRCRLADARRGRRAGALGPDSGGREVADHHRHRLPRVVRRVAVRQPGGADARHGGQAQALHARRPAGYLPVWKSTDAVTAIASMA